MPNEDTVKPLPRGSACLICRSRKIKCDGQRPFCSQCARGNLQDECEYADSGPSKVRILEDTISDLRRRLHEMERSPKRSSHSPGEGSSRSSSKSPNFGILPETQEPPSFIIQTLLHTFLHTSADLHFFLDSARFKESALLPYPIGHHARPFPALLTVAYLWGNFLSRSDGAQIEQVLLTQTVNFLAQASTSDHPFRVMHSIQAELLLSLYLHVHGRIVDAKSHLRTATHLAFQCGLHRIHCQNQSSGTSNMISMHPSRDPVEELERTKGFWTVFIANNSWTSAFGYPSNISYSQSEMRIDTPWPIDDVGHLQYLWSNGSTVNSFLQGAPDQSLSWLALYAKASLLYERATHLFALSKASRSQSNGEALDTLNKLLLGLQSHVHSRKDGPPHIMAITHALSYAATLQLHHRFADHDINSRGLRYTAAKEILRKSRSIRKDERITHVTPMFCVIWRQACLAIIQEALLLKSGAPPLQTPSAELITAPHLKEILDMGMAAMKHYKYCPLMTYQYTIVEEALTSV